MPSLSPSLFPPSKTAPRAHWQPQTRVSPADELLARQAGVSPVAAALLRNRGHGYVERPGYRPLTKFEQRGLGLGHGVRDLVFDRVPGMPA